MGNFLCVGKVSKFSTHNGDETLPRLHQILLHTRNTALEVHEVFKPAFSDNATGRIQTLEWLPQLKHVETSVKDCEHSDHPSIGYTGKDTRKVHKTVS